MRLRVQPGLWCTPAQQASAPLPFLRCCALAARMGQPRPSVRMRRCKHKLHSSSARLVLSSLPQEQHGEAGSELAPHETV